MTTVIGQSQRQRDHVRVGDRDLPDLERVVVGRDGERPRRAAARGPQQIHHPEQHQGQAQRRRGFDQRVAPGERRAEHHSVGERDHAAEQHGHQAAGQKPKPAWLINCQAIRAPIAPTAPKARFRTPVARYRTTMPTPDRAYTPPRDKPVNEKLLDVSQAWHGSSDALIACRS